MRRSITFVILSLCMALFGCATEAPEREVAEEIEGVKVEQAVMIEEDVLALSPDGEPSTSANCSVVQYCNAPGNDGTICRQQAGCSVAAATSECVTEVRNVCGGATCPWKLVRTDGVRIDLCGPICKGERGGENGIECLLP